MEESNKKNKFILFFLVLFACLQNLSLITIGSVSVKAIHIFSILLFPILLKNSVWKFNKNILFYVLYVILISTISIPNYGLNGLILNYIFGLYIFLIIINMKKNISSDEIIDIICKVAFLLIILTWIKNIYELPKIIKFLNNPWAGHPDINTIFGGGVNLEATWLGLFAFFFYKDKKKWLYIGACFFISAIYASRTGLIIDVLVILWFIKPLLKKRNYLFIVLFSSVIAFLIISYSGVLDIVISRFMSKGNDNGSIGRMRMWNYAFETILEYPFGCGIGNCIQALTKVSGLVYTDNNMHNIYMQNFVELGFIGGTWYLITIIWFVIKNFKEFFNNPYLAFIYVYILASLLQFRGGDTIIFIVLALYYYSSFKGKDVGKIEE